jgi:hypothetical protein
MVGQNKGKNTRAGPNVSLGLSVGDILEDPLSLSASLQIVTALPPVTPEKPPQKPTESVSFSYLINTIIGTYEEFDDNQEAVTFMNRTNKVDPSNVNNLVVHDFASIQDLNAFIKALPGPKTNTTAKRNLPIIGGAVAVVPVTASPASVLDAVLSSAKRPKLGFSSQAASPEGDANIRRYKAALADSNSKLEIYHMVMIGGKYDVWGLALKDNNNDYWSWKPTVLEKAIITESTNRLFEAEGTTLDDMLFNVRASHLRETPVGPNVHATISLKGGRKMDKMILFGLIDSPTDEEQVKNRAVEFIRHFQNPRVQLAYSHAMESVMKHQGIMLEAKPSGPVYTKLASTGMNIAYNELGCLAEIFCDETINEIIMANYGFVGSQSSSMWPRKVYVLAYGEGAGNLAA